MDMTAPGTKEGKVYLKDPEGLTFTIYKDGLSTLQGPGGQYNPFNTPEDAIEYLEKLPQTGNSLQVNEQVAIKTLAASNGFDTEEKFVGPKTQTAPFLAIKNKSGEVLWNIRKMNNLFMMYQTEAGGGQKQVTSLGNWGSFWKKMAEVFIAYVAAHPQSQSSNNPNLLSPSEMMEIEEAVKPYGLKVGNVHVQDNIPHIEIYTNWGARVYAFRKSHDMYAVLNAFYDDLEDWKTLNASVVFHEALSYLQNLVNNAFGDGKKLSDSEVQDLMKVATKHNFHTNQKMMAMMPDDHLVYWIEFIDPNGKIPFIIGKDKNTFLIYRTFGDTWENYSDDESWSKTYSKLEGYLSEWGKPESQLGTSAATVSPQPGEHNGITPEEYNEIRDLVDSFGDAFKTQYNKGLPGAQSPFAIILTNKFTGNTSLYATIGALGNYYQIKDIKDAIIHSTGTLNGILQWIKDKLTSMVGAPASISAQDMSDIIHLMKEYKFNSASPGGGANETYIYVKGGDNVTVSHNDYVSFTRNGVFGPIRHKPAKNFINWFQNVYVEGELPLDGQGMAARIGKGLSGNGFIDKQSGEVIPAKKIYAIKWFREYIINLTGGECGLPKSKWAIENIEPFLVYVAQYGLPSMDTHAPDKSGLFGAIPSPTPPSKASPSGGEDLELTKEEQKELGETIDGFAPTIKKQTTDYDQSMNMWVWAGSNIVSYKIEKISGTYFVYVEMQNKWEEVSKTYSFQELKKYISALCHYLTLVLSNSKMHALKSEPTTTPSVNPSKLSLSEVAILKKLIQQFPNVSIGTYIKKKLQESKEKESQFGQAIISDPSHSMWFRIFKENGKYHFSKTSELGQPFELVKSFDLFGNLVEFVDFYINAYCSGDIGPEEKAKFNPPVLDKDQFDWLHTLIKAHFPSVLLKQFKNGVIGAYDSYQKVAGSNLGNPLFAIRPSESNPKTTIVQVFTADNGMASEEYTFHDFSTMSDWIVDHVGEMAQLMDKSPKAIEGQLAGLMDNLGFVYKASTYVGPKKYYAYESGDGQKIYVGSDGSVMAWLKDFSDGEIYKNEWQTLGELVTFLTTGSSSSGPPTPAPANEQKEIKEYLAYLGFSTEHSDSKFSTTWQKIDDENVSDYVQINIDGTSKVTPAPLYGSNFSWPSSAFFFNTFQALKAYLTERYVKKEDFHSKYFSSVLKNGKFKKKKDPDAELGYVFSNGSLTVSPFAHGGTMYTNIGVEPKIKFSFNHTYDLARRVELYSQGDHDYQDPGWSTGDGHLDELIDDVGFKYAGSETYEHAGQVLIFLHKDGYKLRFHTGDSSSSFTFAPDHKQTGKAPTVIAFENTQELKEYLAMAVAAHAQGKPLTQPEHDKLTSTEILKGSLLHYGEEATELISKDLKYLIPNMVDSIHFQHYGTEGFGEVRVLKQNQHVFAIGKKTVGSHILWYVRQKVSDHQYNNLEYGYREYSFMQKQSMVDWIKAHADSLCDFKSVKDDNGADLGTPIQSETPPTPQKEPQNTHDQYYPEDYIVILLKQKGFKAEPNPAGTSWVHTSKFNFSLHENAVIWHYKKGSKEIGMPKSMHEDFLVNALSKATPSDNDEVLDQYFTDASASEEDALFDKALEMADNVAIPYNGLGFFTGMENKGFDFDEHTDVWFNEDLYQAVAAIKPEEGAGAVFKLWWVDKQGLQSATYISAETLFKNIGMDGVLNKQKLASQSKQSPELTPTQIYAPSGETYKVHDNVANASFIWLNEHDEKILYAMGFHRVPQENVYYKNSLGDIVTFRDDGKAEFFEFAGQTHASVDTEQTDSIPQMLKFLVVKYTIGPWSSEDYSTGAGDDEVQEIALNNHDTHMLAQLGFKWDKENKKYIKFYTSKDTPNIQPYPKTKKGIDVPGDDVTEAKKKQKKNKKKQKNDPNQPEPSLGNPEMPPEDAGQYDSPDNDEDHPAYHEVLTCYNTGNAIWMLYEEEGNSEKEIEVYEGSIHKVLGFLWLRWRHNVTKKLVGIVAPTTISDKNHKILLWFGNLMGIPIPDSVLPKFEEFGFVHNEAIQTYYKSFYIGGNSVSIGVKFNGTSYFVYYPYVGNGEIEYKSFIYTDPEFVLNTLKKLKTAEFGPLVQSENEALNKKDGNYLNAPNGWTPYSPYTDVPHPSNTLPETWIDAELKGYGFEWAGTNTMYWYNPAVDDLNVKALLWEAIRFDANGTIVYFYPAVFGTHGERRWFASKDFSEIQHKIETNHGSVHHGELPPGDQSKIPQQPKGNNGKILDGKNYPKAADQTQNFGAKGVPIKLNTQDHVAVLKAGFKFLMNAMEYTNPKTKDKFKLSSDGLVWYQLTGTGDGISNDIGHFFDMLKSKYGQLEWAEAPVSGYELNAFKDKLEKLGFNQVKGLSENNWTFVRMPGADKKTTMNVAEKVIIFPNHSMDFYLEDNATSNMLGTSTFQSVKYGIQTLENGGAGGIALVLAPELNALMNQRGFAYIEKKLRYESVSDVDGHIISITFYGDGIAWLHAMKDYGSGEVDIKVEHKFLNFFNAINWAADKNLSDFAEIAPGKAPSDQETDDLMDSMGFSLSSVNIISKTYKSEDETKAVVISMVNGKVAYDFKYNTNVAGQTAWGKTVFGSWEDFKDWLLGTDTAKSKTKPQSGALDYTPHPSTKSLPTAEPPTNVSSMPFSGFDYQGWAEGKGYADNSTIALMPEDEKVMVALAFQKVEADNGVIYYDNSKGDIIYFYVNGEADYHSGGQSKHYTSVKALMEKVWQAKSAEWKLPELKKKIQTGKDVQTELKWMGFVYKEKNIENNELYFKTALPYIYEVIWDFNNDTIEFIWAEKAKTKTSPKIIEHWTLKTIDALAKLHEGFDALPKKKKPGKVLAGTEDMPWSQINYPAYWVTQSDNDGMQLNFTEELTMTKMGWKRVPYAHGGVAYQHDKELMIFYKMGHVGYISTVDNNNVTQSFSDPEDAIRWLWKNSKEKGKTGKHSETEDMPWSGTDYKKYWASSPENIGLALTVTPDLELMEKMGWATKFDQTGGTGIYYENGNQKMVFHKNGVVFWWADKSNTSPTGTWSDPEDAIRWLWKNSSTQTKQVPYSGTDYKNWYKMYFPKTAPNTAIELTAEDTKILKMLGFEEEVHKNEKDPAFRVSYRNGNNEVLYFFAGGNAAYWKDGMGPTYYDTAKELMQAMWTKYAHGTNDSQQVTSSVYTTIALSPHEEETLAALGFVRLKSSGVTWYEKSGANLFVQFFEDGHASITDKTTASQLDHFDTLQEAIAFLWKKYKPLPPGGVTPTQQGMPWYGNNYEILGSDNAPIKLKPEDEGTMESLGFKQHTVSNQVGSPFYFYQNDKVERFFFRANGESQFLDANNNAQKFETVKAAMEFAWNKYKVPQTTVTGKVPFSGTDYAQAYKDFPKEVTHHLIHDHSLMLKMGFKSKMGQAPDGSLSSYYIHPKTNDHVYFFSDGHGMVMGKKKSDITNFNTVQECLQYLWDKYMPHI